MKLIFIIIFIVLKSSLLHCMQPSASSDMPHYNVTPRRHQAFPRPDSLASVDSYPSDDEPYQPEAPYASETETAQQCCYISAVDMNKALCMCICTVLIDTALRKLQQFTNIFNFIATHEVMEETVKNRTAQIIRNLRFHIIILRRYLQSDEVEQNILNLMHVNVTVWLRDLEALSNYLTQTHQVLLALRPTNRDTMQRAHRQ